MAEQQAAATKDLPSARWRKSSRTQNNGQCVELAELAGRIAVRDSKDPDGPALLFRPASFAAFLTKAKIGELDG